MRSERTRAGQGFVAGYLIRTSGGLIGLGGADFRLPVRIGLLRLQTLGAVILDKAMSLMVVASSSGPEVSPWW